MTRSEAEGLLDPFGLKENGVKKAFRKAALYWHPDKGGDAEMFAKMVEARDVLLEEKEQGFDEDAFAYMMRGWGNSFGQQRFRNVRREKGPPRARNTATTAEKAEGYREYLRSYGRTGKFTFTVNGEKFDIFV